MVTRVRPFLFRGIAVLSFTATAMAQQQLGVGYAYQDVEDHEDPGGSLVLNYSVYLTPSVALQGDVTHSVVYAEQEVFNSSGNSVGFQDFYALSAGAYAVYRLPLGERFFVLGRGGAVVLSSEAETCVVGDCEVEENDPEVSLSFGAGAGFQISPAFDVQLHATQLSAEVRHVGVSLGWSF